jgi:hypothetical protein
VPGPGRDGIQEAGAVGEVDHQGEHALRVRLEEPLREGVCGSIVDERLLRGGH